MLRAAVVGVGHLGRFHAQKYANSKHATLAGVFDVNVERARTVASELKVQVFEKLEDLVGKVDAVTIAATTSAHYEIGRFLLNNGIHVHIEKPLASTSEEGRVLCELAKKNDLRLQVGHVERFNPALVAAQAKLRKPLFIECHRLAPFKPRSLDVNVVLDLMIHDLDIILHLVQSEPVLVEAVGTPVITSTFDIANARIEFASGTVANVTSSRVSLQSQRKFRVFQEAQYLSLDFGAGEVQLHTKIGEFKDGQLPTIESENWSLEKGDALQAETDSFIDSVIKGRECVVTGEDGLKALVLAEQIIAAMEHHHAKTRSAQ